MTVTGIVPAGGYRWRDNQSHKAVMWLVFEERRREIKIKHAGNGREVKVTGRRVDGFSSDTGVDTVYEFYGCFYHGCVFSCAYYCTDCKTPYNTHGDHLCEKMCRRCCEKGRICLGDDCFQNHLKVTSRGSIPVCNKLKKCTLCNSVYKTAGRKTPHVCGEIFCANCGVYYTKEHFCFMVPDKKAKPSGKNKRYSVSAGHGITGNKRYLSAHTSALYQAAVM
ncbi:hypothetical protein J437_LFUL019268 [Ladona fulva]|uniref:Uncharacterized protein n=1 Tax=Ladona fulva TaxID=123851 RepID=A0A8K0KRJ9_LADFU|nr:hypothetical protein J437_LFUL019268 [Ladona fulva]